MGNAIWLFFALPEWFFSTILQPFSAGPLTMVPALGIVSLAVGIVWGACKRELGLLAFLALPIASQVLVVVAGFMRGMLRYEISHPILGAFLLLEIAIAGFLVFRMKGARTPAAALAVFTSSYALFAAFVAGMAFSDKWL